VVNGANKTITPGTGTSIVLTRELVAELLFLRQMGFFVFRFSNLILEFDKVRTVAVVVCSVRWRLCQIFWM